MKRRWEDWQQDEKKAFTAKQTAYAKYQEARDQVNQKDAELKKIKQNIQRSTTRLKSQRPGIKPRVMASGMRLSVNAIKCIPRFMTC